MIYTSKLQPLYYRLLTWDRNIQNVLGLNMFSTANSNPNPNLRRRCKQNNIGTKYANQMKIDTNEEFHKNTKDKK